VADKNILEAYMKKGKELGMEVRGVSDHGFIHSIYFRDPDGYVIELTNVANKTTNYFEHSKTEANAVLEGFMSSVRGIGNAKAIVNTNDWQARKAAAEKQAALASKL
jgi:hypothetical protein